MYPVEFLVTSALCGMPQFVYCASRSARQLNSLITPLIPLENRDVSNAVWNKLTIITNHDATYFT